MVGEDQAFPNKEYNVAGGRPEAFIPKNVKKKPLIRGIGSASDSRGSDLAKQAISAICGDPIKKDYAPASESVVKLHTTGPVSDVENAIETTVCECCEKTDVKLEQLVRIDSGQLLCGECVAEMRCCC